MAYGALEDMKAHWDARGYDRASLDDAALDVLRLKGSIFVDGLGWRETGSGVSTPLFPGAPTMPAQERSWPRTGAADIYGEEIADDAVPGAVERATYEAAFHESEDAGALNRVHRADRVVVSERIDVISRSYQAPSPASGQPPTKPVIPAVMDELRTVMIGGGTNTYGITLLVG